jgi:hypothetical protein
MNVKNKPPIYVPKQYWAEMDGGWRRADWTRRWAASYAPRPPWYRVPAGRLRPASSRLLALTRGSPTIRPGLGA